MHLERRKESVGETRRAKEKPMSDTSRLYGGYNTENVQWLAQAMADLTCDSWDSAKPVIVCGSNPVLHDTGLLSLLAAVKANTSARKLIVRNTRLSLKAQKSLREVLKNNRHLTSIELHNLRCDGGYLLTVPQELFRRESLSELHLSRCSLSSLACKALGRVVRGGRDVASLASLELTKVEFQRDADGLTGLTYLSSALASTRSLQVLKISNLSVPDADKNALLERLSKSTLRVLHLESMSLGEPHALPMACIISNKQSDLQDLSLRKNDLNAEAVEMIVSRGLQRNSRLLRLDLSHNPIGDAGAAALAAGMKSNIALQELRLVDCEIWKAGCSEIVSSIPHLSALTRLSLDENDADLCLDRLISAVGLNFRIVHVLDGLPQLIHAERRQQRSGGASSAVSGPYGMLCFHLRLNRAGRRIIVEPNLSALLLPRVLENKTANSDPSILYYLLRRSVSLYAGATTAKTTSTV
jgi:hypothetical protein